MPNYTVAEASEQAFKAARYFGKVLGENAKGYIACEIDGVVIVVAHAAPAQHLIEALEVHELLGPCTVSRGAAPPEVERKDDDAITGNDDADPQYADVILIPMYHEPPAEHARKKGHVHLHTLNAVKVGRRVRASGECLCSKRHGSNERPPQEGETTMCDECVNVAAEHGIRWTLD